MLDMTIDEVCFKYDDLKFDKNEIFWEKQKRLSS